jgi:hypothetical protein
MSNGKDSTRPVPGTAYKGRADRAKTPAAPPAEKKQEPEKKPPAEGSDA